jgi:hypothetical protein
MSAVALALHLVLAAPGQGTPIGLVPPLDPGPFQGREMVAASFGVLAGDALVLGGAYLTLRLVANGSINPTADNFRTIAYGAVAASILLPPLTAVLLARWARAEPASGAVWKAYLLSVLGQVAALTAGYYASPRLWVVLPVQIVAVSAASTLGLHWGRRPGGVERVPSSEARHEPKEAPPPADTSARAPPLCPDPALASAG